MKTFDELTFADIKEWFKDADKVPYESWINGVSLTVCDNIELVYVGLYKESKECFEDPETNGTPYSVEVICGDEIYDNIGLNVNENNELYYPSEKDGGAEFNARYQKVVQHIKQYPRIAMELIKAKKEAGLYPQGLSVSLPEKLQRLLKEHNYELCMYKDKDKYIAQLGSNLKCGYYYEHNIVVTKPTIQGFKEALDAYYSSVDLTSSEEAETVCEAVAGDMDNIDDIIAELKTEEDKLYGFQQNLIRIFPVKEAKEISLTGINKQTAEKEI